MVRQQPPRRARLAPALTVRDAIESYLADRAAEGQDTARARVQLAAHVLPTWGEWRVAAVKLPGIRD